MTLAALPAASMPLRVSSVMVPELMSSAPMLVLRSTQSRALVAMMGLAPTASVTLAESLTTTLFVIWCTSGVVLRTVCSSSPTVSSICASAPEPEGANGVNGGMA